MKKNITVKWDWTDEAYQDMHRSFENSVSFAENMMDSVELQENKYKGKISQLITRKQTEWFQRSNIVNIMEYYIIGLQVASDKILEYLEEDMLGNQKQILIEGYNEKITNMF